MFVWCVAKITTEVFSANFSSTLKRRNKKSENTCVCVYARERKRDSDLNDVRNDSADYVALNSLFWLLFWFGQVKTHSHAAFQNFAAG